MYIAHFQGRTPQLAHWILLPLALCLLPDLCSLSSSLPRFALCLLLTSSSPCLPASIAASIPVSTAYSLSLSLLSACCACTYPLFQLPAPSSPAPSISPCLCSLPLLPLLCLILPFSENDLGCDAEIFVTFSCGRASAASAAAATSAAACRTSCRRDDSHPIFHCSVPTRCRKT